MCTTVAVCMEWVPWNNNNISYNYSKFVQRLVLSVRGNETENKYGKNYSIGYVRKVCQNSKEANEFFSVACDLYEITELTTSYVP
jgi:hypothetical protein